jgi:hypothetical protein
VHQQDRRRAVAGVIAHHEVGAQRDPVLGHAVGRVGLGRLGDRASQPQQVVEHPARLQAAIGLPLRVGQAEVNP